MSHVPLITPGTRPELAALEATITAARGRISPLYQVLLNSPAITQGWEAMLSAVRLHTQLAPALRELVILRVAVLNRANYEFEAHVPHAQKAGVSAAQIEGTRAMPPTPLDTSLYAAPDALALELTDAMTRDIQVPAALMTRLQAQFDAQGLVELTATIAAYNMVSRFLVALDVGH